MKPYFRGIEMYNDAIMVKIAYPSNWKYFPSEDGRINVTVGEDNPDLTYYYADSNNTTYEEIFDLVEETIKTNQDVILKLKLLKDKVEELKELFSNTEYEKLKTLKFSFEEPKKTKPKRKSTKKKEEPKIEENVEIIKEEEETIKNE